MKDPHTKRFTIAIIITLLLIIFLSISASASQLKIHFLDVGQADSILIQLPNNETMLIDAGDNDDEDKIVNYIKNNNIDKIDYLVGTNPLEEHIGGLDKIIKTFNIDEIYMPNIRYIGSSFNEALKTIKQEDQELNTAKAGVTLFNQKINQHRLKATILAPIDRRYKQVKDYSIVMKLTYGSTSFLFMSDAQGTVEDQLLSANVNLDADVLKAGDHGSNSATTTFFLQAVMPRYAVISTGDYDINSPPLDTIDKLQRWDTKVFLTDKQGTIIATSNGNDISFVPSNNPNKN